MRPDTKLRVAEPIGYSVGLRERFPGGLEWTTHDGARLWATELGWSDTGPSSPQRVGAQKQATEITKLVKLMVRQRRSLKLRGFVYFGWRDGAPYAGKDFWGLHTGLLNIDGQPKPAYSAFQKAVAAAG